MTDEATLDSAAACLLTHLPLEMTGSYTLRDLFEILLRAASRGNSIEHTVRSLQGAPSGNGVRYHLDKLAAMAVLERQVNAALHSRIPPKIARKRQRMAIDLHLIPYYGTPTAAEAPYVYRSQAKAGTTHFFAYASLYVICRNKRVTLALPAVPCDETLVATITFLLAILHPLRVRVKRLYLDRGFYSVPVIRWLKAINIPFLLPAVIRGKQGGTRALLKGRKSYATHYTITSPHYGAVACQMRVVCSDLKGDLIYLRYWLIEGKVLNPTEILALDPDKYALIIRLAEGFTVPDEYLGLETPTRKRTRAVQLDHVVGTCIPEFDNFTCACGWASELNVPCVIGEFADGALTIYRGAGLPYSESEIALAETLSAQLALALQASRLAEEAKQVAIAREQEQAAQAQAAELARANSLLRHSLSRLSTNPNLDNILGHLLVELVSYAGASVGHIFIYDVAQETLKLKARCCDGQAFCTPAADEPALFQMPIPIAQTQIFTQLRAQPRLAVMNQDEFEGRMWQGVLEWLQAKSYRGTSSCILMVGDRPFGLLAMAFAQPIAFHSVEEELILALTQQIALVIQLTLLSEADKQRAIAREREKAALESAIELKRVNTLLRDSVAQLSQQADVNTFLGQVAGEILHYLNAANVFILRYSPENHTLCLCLFHDGSRLRWGTSDEELALFAAPFSADITPAFEIMFRERRMFTPSNYSSFIPIPVEEFALPGGLEWMERINTSDAAITALFAGDTPIGTIHIQFTNGQQMRQEDEAFFLSLTQQAAIALRIADLAEKAKQVAILEERNRMARDIHDTLAQSFTGIIMQLETLKGNAPSELAPAKGIVPDDIQTRLDRISDLARLGLAEARRSVQALRPQLLEAVNFATALRHLLHQFTHDTPICATLNIKGTSYPLPDTVEENLLRIAQEALTNAIRHGHAHTITLQLLFEPAAVHLQISDDGNGFDPHSIMPTGFGLVGMQERTLHLSGHFHFVSHPGQGTEITVTVPL